MDNPMGKPSQAGLIDLLSADNGGRAICCNDEHYGSMHNLNSSRTAASMADGWETRRRREPGFDWVIFELAEPGQIIRVEIDTAFFKGNFPKSFSLNGEYMEQWTDQSIAAQSLYWPVILPDTELKADNLLSIKQAAILKHAPITHLRLNIFPDGGISRLRIFGVPT